MDRQLNVGVGGQAIELCLIHVVNPVRGWFGWTLVVDRDAGLCRAIGVAGFVLANLSVGTGLQAEQFGTHEPAGMARQAVQRGAHKGQAVLM
jgi:hypothetical protein